MSFLTPRRREGSGEPLATWVHLDPQDDDGTNLPEAISLRRMKM